LVWIRRGLKAGTDPFLKISLTAVAKRGISAVKLNVELERRAPYLWTIVTNLNAKTISARKSNPKLEISSRSKNMNLIPDKKKS